MLLAALAVMGAGCGGSHPPAGVLLEEINETEKEALAIAPGPDPSPTLHLAQQQRDAAAPLVQKGKDGQAAPILERGLATMRAARARAEFERASAEADGCRQAVAAAREGWQQALIALERTEKAANRNNPEILREDPEIEEFLTPPAGWPEIPGSETEDAGAPPPPLEEQEKAWEERTNLAGARTVAVADLAPRFAAQIDPVRKGAGKDERAQRLRVSGAILQELAYRVRAADARATCVRGAALVARLGNGRDQALQATLDMERGLRDDLRAELERTREEAWQRQSSLYDALKSIEGKYAHITQTARGAIVSLADILFDFDKATLKRNVEFSLVKVATILNQFPEMQIAVEGHTDDIGTAEYNLDLSKRRAQAVYEFLVQQEVSAERMTVEGYGLTRPVADNSTEEGRQKNRRVDLVVQGQ